MSSIGRNLTEVKKQDTSLAAFVNTKVSHILNGPKRDAFVTSVVSAVMTNPDLAKCARGSIVSSALQGAALDLSPSPVLGHFYMVPYNDRKNDRFIAQFQLGYKGYIQLAIRSGQYRRINVLEIREGELLGWNPFAEKISVVIDEDYERREQKPVIGYYAMFELVNGFEKSVYWSREKMESHALRYSRGYAAKKGYTFWEKDFDQMAFKTLLRHLISKWGVMSIEMQSAIEKDMTIIDENGDIQHGYNDLIDVPTEPIPDPIPEAIPGTQPEPEAKAGTSPADSFFE